MDTKMFNGGVSADDRGTVRFVNDFDFKDVKRFYHVTNHRQGFIRAWHGHKLEGKYVYAVKGTFLIGVVPLVPVKDTPAEEPPIFDTRAVPTKYILSDHKPSVLWIPPMYANGFKSLTDDGHLIFFSTSTLEQSKGDDIRWGYDAFGYGKFWEEEFR